MFNDLGKIRWIDKLYAALISFVKFVNPSNFP